MNESKKLNSISKALSIRNLSKQRGGGWQTSSGPANCLPLADSCSHGDPSDILYSPLYKWIGVPFHVEHFEELRHCCNLENEYCVLVTR